MNNSSTNGITNNKVGFISRYIIPPMMGAGILQILLKVFVTPSHLPLFSDGTSSSIHVWYAFPLILKPLNAQATISHDGFRANIRSANQRILAGLVMRNANFRPLESAVLLIGNEKMMEVKVAVVLNSPRVNASAPFTSTA